MIMQKSTIVTNGKYTHIGLMCWIDSKGSKKMVKIRETKLYWITEHGNKYMKNTGRGIGDYPLYALDLSTIKPL